MNKAEIIAKVGEEVVIILEDRNSSKDEKAADLERLRGFVFYASYFNLIDFHSYYALDERIKRAVSRLY